MKTTSLRRSLRRTIYVVCNYEWYPVAVFENRSDAETLVNTNYRYNLKEMTLK